MNKPGMNSSFEKQDLKIYTLGSFMVCRGDVRLSSDYGRSRKLWELFMFLITHREKPYSPEAILETLWPDQEYADPNKAMKNIVHRLRQKLDGEKGNGTDSAIINSHGCYNWNSDSSYWFDAEEFETICLEARAKAVTDPEAACHLYSQGLDLYRGEYLPESPYSDWLLPIRYHYRRLFIDSALRYMELLKKLKKYSLMIEECEKFIALERFEEEFHLRYIEALLAERKIAQARSHYEHVSSLFYREFGAKPSAAMRSLYGAIRKQGMDTEVSFTDVRDILHELDEAEGPLYCEREFFRILCRLEKRRSERENRPVHIGLLTFTEISELKPGSNKLKDAMEKLNEALSASLRKGDVFSTWKETQFAILLPGTTSEQAGDALKRTMKRLKKDLPALEKANLQSSVYPLLSADCLNSR